MDKSTVEVSAGHLYLGPVIDPKTGDPVPDSLVQLEAADLTTHGVIVGMTGSGKTGLGICLIEEALLDGVATLVIDPKGDMGNLLLTFPNLAPADFRPWVNERDAERDSITVDQLAESTAETWESGLAKSGIGKDRITELRAKAGLTIYTPGSTAGVPLNVIGDLRAPAGNPSAEDLQDEVDGLVSGLLSLVGVESDPLSGREHVLLANLISRAWSNGEDLDLAGLLAQIQDPPMRKLGVIELDTFFPASDRTKLVLKLNGLLASPGFAAWGEGVPLDIEEMLFGGGKPNAAIVSIAHLSEEERQFVVTLLLSKLVTWMRGQPGSPDLRVLVYMDEVFGYVPPTAQPPAKKPILTILKQARAFGVGMVLSTQNPVDLDYKALSNAGTWMIGRLQTERDKARLLDGLSAARGDVDTSSVGDVISGLGKRQFVFNSAKGGGPTVMGTRWAMSYLPGPLTRDQISTLTADAPQRAQTTAATSDSAPAAGTDPAAPAESAPASTALADDESAVMPVVADGTRVAYADPAAVWASEAGAVPGGHRLVPAVAARVQLLFDDTKGDLRHEAEWEAIVVPAPENVTAADFRSVDYDDRDLRDTAPEGAAYVLSSARIDTKTYFKSIASELREHLYRSEQLNLFANPTLKLYSRVGESREEFEARCAVAADAEADKEADGLRQSLIKKQDSVKAAIAKAEDRVRELESNSSDRKRSELLSGAMDIVGGLLGGRKSARSILGGVKRASSGRRMSSNASERLTSAQNRLEEKTTELDELADELTDSLSEAQQVWDDAATAIEEFDVGLEKTDISISEVVLVWLPT